MEEKILYWVDIAEYDMLTAEAMYQTKRYLYVGFMCHQIIEKLLKAYYVKSQNQTPPYTQNLLYLAETTNLVNELNQDILEFFDELQPLNIDSRYPSYKIRLLNKLTDDYCEHLLLKTKGFFEWIKKRL